MGINALLTLTHIQNQCTIKMYSKLNIDNYIYAVVPRKTDSENQASKPLARKIFKVLMYLEYINNLAP